MAREPMMALERPSDGSQGAPGMAEISLEILNFSPFSLNNNNWCQKVAVETNPRALVPNFFRTWCSLRILFISKLNETTYGSCYFSCWLMARQSTSKLDYGSASQKVEQPWSTLYKEMNRTLVADDRKKEKNYKKAHYDCNSRGTLANFPAIWE